MADNSTLPATSDVIRDVQKGGTSGPKSQVVIIDRGGSGTEDLSPLDGTDITTPTAMPAGGVGIRGWLSAIWTKLNGSLAVTGTFWQATQPVSIAATVNTNTGLTQPLTDTQLRATAVPVSIAATVNTSATVSNFPATQAVSLATNTPDVTDRAARVLGVVTQAPLTKGTQGANGVTTQDLKDSGRVAISFTAEFSPVATTEAMLTLSVSKDGGTPSTTSSYAITAGKRLRIASKSIAVENTLGTSIQRAYLRTRFAATGGAVVASPMQANIAAAAAGTVKSIASNFDDYPDGMEFLGDGTKAIGWSLQAPDWVSATSTLKVYVTIICFEY